MRNRWFHTPFLHSTVDGMEKKVTWLELFYDLVFVAAFIQLGNGLSAKVSPERFLAFSLLFVPLWVSWTGMTFFMNRFTVDDFVHRAATFLQMLCVGAMAIAVPQVMDGEYRVFSWAYALAQGLVAFMYLRTAIQVPDARPYCRYWGGVFAAAALMWLLAGFVGWPWIYLLWGGATALIFTAPFHPRSRALMEAWPIDEEHLTERYGLLTIIVLGESFVKVLGGLAGSGATGPVLLQAGLLLTLTICIWWIYFDDVAGSHIRGKQFAPMVWVYAHLPLQIGITATGVAIKKAVTLEMMSPAPGTYLGLLAGTLALTLVSVGVIDSVTERRQSELSDRTRVFVRYGSALILLLLAAGGEGMTALMAIGLVTAICVAQVVFDMMMAPLETASVMEHQARPLHAGRAAPLPGDSGRPRRRDMREAVRKGTPAALRQDLYYFFMRGSWTQFLASLIFLYIMINVFFGLLYLLKPGCVAAVREGNFLDAFFFSVQTMSTIGYGAMAPLTSYGHAVVTLEAAVGLLSVALATGFMFAKVSQPRSAVLFSRSCVITRHDGCRTLMFRLGNTRGNEVADANLQVSVVLDSMSAEGHHLRRLEDLELVRDRSPVFALTWQAMHRLDEASPLREIDWHDPEGFLSLVVVLTGHDGTYGQMIYARHMYYPEDIQCDHRFVDILSELPDGRIMVDYDRFHEVEPTG